MIETASWHSLRNLATRCRHRNNPRAAIAYLEQAITKTRDVPDLADETTTMLNSLAGICLSEGLLEKAELTIRQALQLTALIPEFYAPNLLILARILHKQNRQREAEIAGREGLRLVREEFGFGHSCTMSAEATLTQLGITYSNGWWLGFIPPRIASFFAGRYRLFVKPRI